VLRDWFHVIGATYGSWLPGDPRGFRTRHHRTHVPYDYKRRPPRGAYDELHERSKRLMNRPPVRLSWRAREIALREMVHVLESHGVVVRVACVGPTHFHALIRVAAPTPTVGDAPGRDRHPWASRRDGNDHLAKVRHLVGNAKRRASRALLDAQLVRPGGVWSKRVEVVPVRSTEHGRATIAYILEHVHEGAVVLDRPPR
jgi:hypothetical protein